MKHFTKISGIFLLLLIVFSLSGCGGGNSSTDNGGNTPTPTTPPAGEVTHDDIIYDYKVDLLKDELFYVTVNQPSDASLETANDGRVAVQALKQFDFIVTGSDPGTPHNGEITGAFIPGVYGHMVMYIGKDSDGLAYGIEMTGNEDANVYIREDGTINVDGQLYVYCLGSDYSEECPKTDFTWDVFHRTDHRWAKRLEPKLHEKITAHKEEMLAIIKNDLETKFPFQLHVQINFGNYSVDILDDGRENGADCTSYMVMLLEDSAGVCMDDIYEDAKGFTDYFLNDPKGQGVYFSGDVNPFGDEDLYVSDFLNMGITIRDNSPRQTACSDGRKVVGVPTPDKVFHSQSLVDIPEV